MFKVENADFIADKLAAELLPLQEYREVLKNALEAIERRQRSHPASGKGRVEFDVDWQMLSATGNWYVSCADNGDGMSPSELGRYTTTLAVQGASLNQSLRANQGMGLKISGPTRHKKGILIRTLRDDESPMVKIGWNGKEYGLLDLDDHGAREGRADIASFPQFLRDSRSGTVVTFLGNEGLENTFEGKPAGWLMKYLQQRFFRLATSDTSIVVRVPSGQRDAWPRSFDEAQERQGGKGGPSFNFTLIKGTATIWDDAADRLGPTYRGVSRVPGNEIAGVPPADFHWWVLPKGPGTDVSTRTYGGGSIAVLFQNELHDWRTSGHASSAFGRLGILFGKNRVSFVIEPLGASVYSDFARAHVLISGTPVFESDAWLEWADQFKRSMPAAIRATIEEEHERLQEEDPDRAKRIQNRLREINALLRPRRFRPASDGPEFAGPDEAAGAGGSEGKSFTEGNRKGTTAPKPRPYGTASLLAEPDGEEDGQPSNPVYSSVGLDPQWVTVAEAEGSPLVKADDRGLEDRAAALAGTDGRTATILLLNSEFRGYQVLLSAINRDFNESGDDNLALKIEMLAKEWIEQKMIEAISGVRQLENGRTWTTDSYDSALSPASLTAVFMADRYHTLREVRAAIRSFGTRDSS
ncbi:MAG: hypothetical protein GC160_17400 [Acidobacteria bacterium]|nr:hypothetical protein [Acidobacteriota bacterium]